jgi:hypothetical protein
MLGEARGTSRYFARVRRSGAVARAKGAVPEFDYGNGRWPGFTVSVVLSVVRAAGRRVAGSFWWKIGAMQ